MRRKNPLKKFVDDCLRSGEYRSKIDIFRNIEGVDRQTLYWMYRDKGSRPINRTILRICEFSKGRLKPESFIMFYAQKEFWKEKEKAMEQKKKTMEQKYKELEEKRKLVDQITEDNIVSQ